MALRKVTLSLSKLPNWLDAIWLCALALYALAGAAIVPFHGDESTQIFMGRDYYYLFLEGDLSKIHYVSTGSESPIEQHLRTVNGTISKTIHGWLAARNGFEAADINGPWEWDYEYDANRAADGIPDAELLRQARLASSAQLAVAVAVFFAFVRLSINRPTAYLASAIFAFHPTVLINGRRAMMEGSHLLGMMLVLLVAVWLLRERKWWQFLLLGVCSGFAIAAKHPNAFVVTLVFLACASWIVYELAREAETFREDIFRSAVGVLAATAVTIIVFLLLNPAWWRTPLNAASGVLAERVELLNRQIERYGSYESGIEKIVGFWQHVFVAEIQYFEDERWADYDENGAQISHYQASGWSGARIGGSVAGGLLSLALGIGGSLILARDRTIYAGVRGLILVWGGGIALITLAVTPLSWTRYYLPLLPVLATMSAIAIVTLARHSSARIKSLIDGVNILD